MTESPSTNASRPPRRQAYGLAVVGGVLYFLGWAGFGFWPLSFICLVPLWRALELGLGRTWRHTLAVAWLYGTVTMAGGYHWLVEFLDVFSGYGYAASALFWLVFSAYLGFNFVVYGLIYRALRLRGWSASLIAVPVLILIEWLYPSLFPTYLSNSVQDQTHLVQIADLGGPMLVTAVMGLVNLSVYEAWSWRARRRPAPKGVWALTVAAIAFTVAYGTVRIAQVEAQMEVAPVLRLGIVQVNMGIFEKRTEALEGHRRHLEQSHQLEEAGDLDLLVWPESAFVGGLPRKLPMDARRVLQDLKTPVLFGGVSTELVDGQRKIYNTVFLADENGIVESTYDKTYLLMFGEYLPFGDTFPVLYELSPNSGHFTAGTHVRPINLGEWRISTPVCYEDVLARFTRRMVREANPHILINLTNDAWFGDTQEPGIHLVLSQYRAIEHRRYMVRATNSGISAVVDPLGRIVAQTGVLTRENLRYDVHMLDGDTIYTRFGDWVGWLGLAAVAWMLIRRRDAEQ
ncbi:MAG: apolipoprotein N-acyltransferase [Myxococcales bacterium]|nr:MAG: apolipoprotein N-acyltransferase [Myxococcales bacterium]